MAVPSRHTHVSERETAHRWPDGQYDNSAWEDCLWCSAIMWLRLVRSASIPATLREAELLRDASGEPTYGGSNMDDLKRGLARRYGFYNFTTHYSADSLWAALTPGKAAVVQGDYGDLPSTLRRWQSSYAGGHAVMVIRSDTSPYGWWDDPLAPSGIGYRGQWVHRDTIKRFANGQAGARHIVARIFPTYKYRASVQPYPLTKTRKFFVYTLHNGEIAYRQEKWTGGFTANCTAPQPYKNNDQRLAQSSYDLVKLTSSEREGEYIDAKWAKRIST
jgi:hypothetical protein